jgi:type II secretory pathway pseudopilin PulG
MRSGRSPAHASQAGYTLVVVLVLLLTTSLALAVAGPSFAWQGQRAKEQELLRIGNLYAQALQSYYDAAPGSLRRYPTSLDQLLLDTRYPGTMRHLRQLYADPLQPDRPWGLVLDRNDGIVGVYSTSDRQPIAQAGREVLVAQARQYSEWKFLAKAAP